MVIPLVPQSTETTISGDLREISEVGRQGPRPNTIAWPGKLKIKAALLCSDIFDILSEPKTEMFQKSKKQVLAFQAQIII